MTKYIGKDVHGESTVVVHQNEDGQVISQSVIRTRPEPLIAEVSGYNDRTEVVFEEAQWSAWLYELLRPHVQKVAVHAAEGVSNKTDFEDARRLAKLLRLGEIDEVYHGPKVDTELKSLVKGYHNRAGDLRDEKNALKGLFIGRCINCGGAAIYNPETRQEWLEKLDGPGVTRRAEQRYEKIDLAREQKAEMKQEMKKAAKQRAGWQWLRTLPGFGVVRTSTVLGIVGTPWRFPTKQKLWSYVGLGVDFDESAEHVDDGRGGLERKEKRQTLGLTDEYNRRLKDVYKGATETAIREYEEVRQDYEARCRRKDASNAKLDIARKLVAQSWTIWKRQEEYDADKACWDEL